MNEMMNSYNAMAEYNEMARHSIKQLRLAVEVGNLNVDVIGDKYVDTFQSKFRKQTSTKHDVDSTTLVVNGNIYNIGEGALTNGLSSTKDMNTYELFLLFAMCNNAKSLKLDPNCTIFSYQLAIGLPLTEYNDTKDLYSKFFDGKQYKVEKGGVVYRLRIEVIRVLPQAGAYALVNPNKFTDYRQAFVIDFGSWTVDIQELNKGKIRKDRRLTMTHGTLTMYEEVRELLHNKYGVIVNDISRIDEYMMDGEVYSPKAQEVIDIRKDVDIIDIINRNISSIKETICNAWVDAHGVSKIYLIGGGAMMFENELKSMFDTDSRKITVLQDNANLANAIAYYNFLGGKQNAQ